MEDKDKIKLKESLEKITGFIEEVHSIMKNEPKNDRSGVHFLKSDKPDYFVAYDETGTRISYDSDSGKKYFIEIKENKK